MIPVRNKKIICSEQPTNRTENSHIRQNKNDDVILRFIKRMTKNFAVIVSEKDNQYESQRLKTVTSKRCALKA